MKKIMSIDLTVFSVLAVFTEAAATLLLDSMVPMYYCTLSMAVAQIAMLRWGVAGVVIQAISGLVGMILGKMSLVDGFLFHVAANLFLGLPMLIYGNRDRDVLADNPVFLCFYLMLSHLCLCIGKGIAIWMITGERTGIRDYLGASLLVFVINTIVLLVLRNVKNLVIDTKEEYYHQAAEQIIGFYAKNYCDFAIHNKNNDTYSNYGDMAWGCGRIMPQGLNEAIVAIRIAQALEVLDDDVSEELRQSVKEMFLEIFQLLRPQATSIHNISCWLLAAIGVMGFHIGDERMVNFAFHSEYGMHRQLREGVTQDGFWYEGSIHYNFFLLEGVSFLALFAHNYGYDLGKESLNTLSWMLERAYAYAFDGGTFPTPNDGWPDINLKTYIHVYHTFARVFGEKSIVGELVKNIEASQIPRVTLPMSEPYYIGEMPLEKLMFNIDFEETQYTPIPRSSYNYPLSNFAMIRSGKINAFLKYGLNGKSHAHPDIMNIEIAYDGHRVTRDLSNAGYSSQLCNQWHRKSLAHNTVVFNGRDITSVKPGESMAYVENAISARAENVYDGVTYGRTVAVHEHTLTDNFHVWTQEQGTFDYVLHLEKDVLLEKPENTIPAELGFSENGYQYASNVLLCDTDQQEITLTALGRNVKLTIRISLSGDK